MKRTFIIGTAAAAESEPPETDITTEKKQKPLGEIISAMQSDETYVYHRKVPYFI